AAANILATALRNHGSTDALLANVQKRRAFPTNGTQAMQVIVHKGLSWVFRQRGPMKPPLPLRLVTRIPGFQARLARTVGIGLRPEHVHTPDLHSPAMPRIADLQ
ncbi:MAG: hypothetical protein WA476_08680, partial [Acidobacteriaceae bacterium]